MLASEIPRRVRRRVRRGALKLDHFRPGWAGRINLERLDIGDSEYCIAGQLEGNFYGGYDQLGLPGSPEGNGMNLCRLMKEHPQLTAAWKEELRTRLLPELIPAPTKRTVWNLFGLLKAA